MNEPTDDSSKRVTRETLADALMRVAGHLPGPDGQPDEPMAQRIFDALPVTPTQDPEADADLEQAWARLQRDYYSVGGEARRTGMEVAVHRRRIEAALPATPAASETADAAWETEVERLAAALNDAQVQPDEMRLGRDLTVPARRILRALSRSTPTDAAIESALAAAYAFGQVNADPATVKGLMAGLRSDATDAGSRETRHALFEAGRATGTVEGWADYTDHPDGGHDDEYDALARQMHESIAEGQTILDTAKVLRLLAAAPSTPTTEGRICGCTADTELGMSSGCGVCGHRDHGSDGCRARLGKRP